MPVDPASAPSGYHLLGEHLSANTATDVAATFEYSDHAPVAGATPEEDGAGKGTLQHRFAGPVADHDDAYAVQAAGAGQQFDLLLGGEPAGGPVAGRPE